MRKSSEVMAQIYSKKNEEAKKRKRKTSSEILAEKNINFKDIQQLEDTSGFFKGTDAFKGVTTSFDDGYQVGDVFKTAKKGIDAYRKVTRDTSRDLALDIAEGFLNTTEGVADTLQYGLAGVFDWFGADRPADAIRENAKFNSTGAIFGRNEDPADNFSKGWTDSIEKTSVIGDMGDSVAQGVGNVTAMAGMSYLTGGSSTATALSSFASGYGQARSKAYAEGMDDKTSHRAGIVSGMAEAISEQFFNGIPGMKTAGWGEKFTGKIGNQVSRFFGSKVGKITMEVLDKSGEGAEEIISNILSTTGNNIMHLLDNDYTYGMENSRILKDGYQFGDITKDNFDAAFSQESLNAFISATLTSSIIGGGKTFISTNQKNAIIKSYAEENGISVEEAKTQLQEVVQAKTNKTNLPFNEKLKLEEKTEQEHLDYMKKGTFAEQRDQVIQNKETNNEMANNLKKGVKPNNIELTENMKSNLQANENNQYLANEIETKTKENMAKIEGNEKIEYIKTDMLKNIETSGRGNRPSITEQVKENGITEPLIITINDDGVPVLDDGNHRLESAMELGLKEIPVMIREANADQTDMPFKNLSELNTDYFNKMESQLPMPEQGAEVNNGTLPTLDNTNLSDAKKVQNLPVASEETSNKEVTSNEKGTKTTEDLGDKSVLNNTVKKNSIKAKESVVKVAKNWLNLKDNNKLEFKEALDEYTKMSQEELLTSDSYEEIKSIVDRYSENEIVYTDEDVKEVKSRVRNAKIKVTEDLKAQITDYEYFRKSNFGKLKLGNKGIYVDVLWNELSETYPHYFSSDIITEVDMLQALSDFMNEDFSVTQRFTLDDSDITKITNDVYDIILENALSESQIKDLKEKDSQLSKSKEIDAEHIKTAESVLGNQEKYLSNRAEELFNEISDLKKGVRASDELSQILNLGYKWSDIKAALSNIKWKPGMEVNSKNTDLGDIETTIKNMINEEYQNKVQDLIFDEAKVKGDLSKEDTAKLKRYNYAKEVESLRDALETTSAELDKSIIQKQAEYDGKANKDTVVAQKLLQQVSTLKLRKANIELDYNNRIANLTEKIKNFDVKEETRRMSRAEYKQLLSDEITPLIEKASKWKDKKLLGGFRYSRETAQRNMVDVAGEVEGNAINDYIFNQVPEHEASKNRRVKEKFQAIKDLKLDLKEQFEIDGEKVGEDDLVRRYIENSLNKNDLEMMGADANKIINAADKISEILESIYTDTNLMLKKMGLPELEHRKDYFPHAMEDKKDTFLSKLVSVVGIDITNQELPSEIAGRTDEFKPNRAWSGHFLKRKGNKTNTDAISNLEKYIIGMEDIIAHTEDIQKVRTLSQEIRNQFTSEEIKAKVEAINKNESLSEEEKDELIKEIYKRDDSQLSGLVTWLDDYANVLSNKKSFADRNIERKIGRNAYTSMANIEGMIASNTVGGNASVSLTNFAPIVQALATTKGRHLVKASLDVMKNDVNTLTGNENTSIKDMSDFLTNRFGIDGIGRQTLKDKIKNIAFKPMEVVDNFVSEVVVRAKYYENLENGMDTYKAIKKADRDAGKIMADRSKGSLPTIFNEKNPLSKLITMFQVEPNNIISNYTKDMSRDAETKGQLAYQYTKLAIGSYVFNSILMGIRGGNEVLPDPIRFIQYLIQAITGDDEEREKAGENMLEAVTSAVPFVSNVAGLLGMEDVGRVPISSALPDLTELVNLGDDEVSGEYKAQVVRDEILKPLSYFLLPTGAAQVWKTVQGLDTVVNEGSYKYAKDGELKMQFPVEDANIVDYAKAGLFGKYSLDEAKTYIDSGFKSLNEKQTQEYKELNLPYEEYLEYRKGLSGLNTEEKFNYIYNLPVSDEQKNIMINNATNRENEIDISNYGEYGSLAEFDYANKNPEKHLAITQITDYDSYVTYKEEINNI